MLLRSVALLIAGLVLLNQTARAQDAPIQLTPVSHVLPPHANGAPCCEPPKVCVPLPDKKKTPKVTYSCKTEDFCLPRCSCGLFGKKGCCQACLDCEKPRTRRVLIKKIKEEECDVLKCKPVIATCPAGCAEPIFLPNVK